jgi:sugar/nucleoside kinase (ribokinase family)
MGSERPVTPALPATSAKRLVVVVGDVMNDVVVRPLAAVDVATDTPSQIEFSRGGSAANQAAWLAALGASVRFAGRAGAADAAEHERALRRLGVDVRLAVDSAATGTVVALVSEDGERSMFTDRGANQHLSGADLEGLLEGASLLHVSAYQLFEPRSRPALRALWNAAAQGGIPTSVDPASFAGVRDAGRDAFLDWTSGARLLFPNLDEGRLLSGEEEPEAIVESLLAWYPVVALKLGPGGALAGTADGARVRLPAEAASVVDSTGAGDAFCAGFLARFVSGEALESCTAAGLTAAARVISQAGARPQRGELPRPAPRD